MKKVISHWIDAIEYAQSHPRKGDITVALNNLAKIHKNLGNNYKKIAQILDSLSYMGKKTPGNKHIKQAYLHMASYIHECINKCNGVPYEVIKKLSS